MAVSISRSAQTLARTIIVPALAVLITAAAYGQTLPPAEAGVAAHLAASSRHGEWARYDAGAGDMVDAWVVYPERADKAPVVIVIHEIFGLNDWARAVADQYAAEGFIAIAPDFLSGKAPDGKGGSAVLGAEGGRAAMGKLEAAEVLRRLDGAAAYAASLPSASKAFAAVGFCWGGGISFSWATKRPDLGAAVVFYGTSPATASLAAVKAPILGLYGGADARVNATIAEAKAELDRLGKRYETEIYEGAGHAFLRQQTGQNGANMRAATAAWPRSVRFLRAALEKTSANGADSNQAWLATLSVADDCGDSCALIE